MDLSTVQSTKVDLANRRIYLWGSVNEEMSFNAIAGLHALDEADNPIVVYLNSDGGSEGDGWAMYDAFCAAQSPVVVYGIGLVQSMAMILLQMGDRRLLTPNTRLMCHLGAGPDLVNPHSLVIKALGKEQEVNDLNYIGTLAAHSNKTHEQMSEWCTKETYMSAYEAVDNGLADEVILLDHKSVFNSLKKVGVK